MVCPLYHVATATFVALLSHRPTNSRVFVRDTNLRQCK